MGRRQQQQDRTGWQPLQAPATDTSGFTRLARVHVLSTAADTLVAASLAGSLFFSIDPSAARWRVGLSRRGEMACP